MPQGDLTTPLFETSVMRLLFIQFVLMLCLASQSADAARYTFGSAPPGENGEPLKMCQDLYKILNGPEVAALDRKTTELQIWTELPIPRAFAREFRNPKWVPVAPADLSQYSTDLPDWVTAPDSGRVEAQVAQIDLDYDGQREAILRFRTKGVQPREIDYIWTLWAGNLSNPWLAKKMNGLEQGGFDYRYYGIFFYQGRPRIFSKNTLEFTAYELKRDNYQTDKNIWSVLGRQASCKFSL
jgi:hypothetical protein